MSHYGRSKGQKSGSEAFIGRYNPDRDEVHAAASYSELSNPDLYSGAEAELLGEASATSGNTARQKRPGEPEIRK